MSEVTKIEWCDHSWSPWFGCDKVSEGCKFCYITTTPYFRFNDLKHGDPRVRASESYWKKAHQWNKQAEKDGVRKRVFPSLCDWLDVEAPIECLIDFLQLIHDTPWLDWLLLTKRIENFFKRLQAAREKSAKLNAWVGSWIKGVKIPHNVWIGVSTENQKRADERIPLLLNIPARIRFLSVEPLIGPVDLAYTCFNGADSFGKMPGIDWVIVGGESGRSARECELKWIRSVVDDCKGASVPCFVKQLGAVSTLTLSDKDGFDWGKATYKLNHPKGGDPSEWPEDLRVRQFPQFEKYTGLTFS